jgi:hypothetical protein
VPARLIWPLLDAPVLPRPPAWATPHSCEYIVRNLIFLKPAVPRALEDAPLEVAWREALQALLDLQPTYA